MKPAAFIALIWAGILLGSSFLATPAKFLAPSLSLAEALDVGRVTFSVLSWVEAALFCALTLSLWPLIKAKVPVMIFALITLLLIIQQFVLLPALDTRALMIIQGGEVTESNLHTIYIVQEFLKLCLLIALALVVSKVTSKQAPKDWELIN